MVGRDGRCLLVGPPDVLRFAARRATAAVPTGVLVG